MHVFVVEHQAQGSPGMPENSLLDPLTGVTLWRVRRTRARLARGSNVALFRVIRARVSNTLAAANNVNVNALLHARTPATIDRAGHAGVAILSFLAEFLCYATLVNDNSIHNQLAKQFLTTNRSQIRLSDMNW
jgi:hypothetical protein